MRRKPSTYLPEALEYLICRNDVQSVLMSSIVLSLGEGRGMVGSGASFAAAPRSLGRFSGQG
jgi:hypothetical protein